MSYVLVVDDEEPIRKILRRQLIGWGYSVRTAPNAKEALEYMFGEPAAIAVIDIGMPGRDGLWLTERIREKWSKTVIVIITGAADIETIERSRQLGVVDYVLKPFGSEVLRQALQRAATALNDSTSH
jgi:CheY-like chemotaxis protein